MHKYLKHVVLVDNGIKTSEHSVNAFNYLHGRRLRTNVGEVHDITEQYRHLIEHLQENGTS